MKIWAAVPIGAEKFRILAKIQNFVFIYYLEDISCISKFHVYMYSCIQKWRDWLALAGSGLRKCVVSLLFTFSLWPSLNSIITLNIWRKHYSKQKSFGFFNLQPGKNVKNKGSWLGCDSRLLGQSPLHDGEKQNEKEKIWKNRKMVGRLQSISSYSSIPF